MIRGMNSSKSAAVVGSGPNGLAAAIALARAGVHVTVFEAAAQAGGCLRSEALTLPGCIHDAGAGVFPLAKASPFLRTLPLEQHGLTWIEPDVPVAHPLDDGDSVALLHDVNATASLLGEDAQRWNQWMRPLLASWPSLLQDALSPLLRIPRHPFRMARLGMDALHSARNLANHLRTTRAKALFAGLAAHAAVPLEMTASAGEGLVLAAAAHSTGWPVARGGSQSVANAMLSLLQELGAEIVLQHPVASLRDLPQADALLLDVTPRQFVSLAGDALSQSEAKVLSAVQLSPGACKVDWALSSPIPWQSELPRRAGTVHLGGSFEEIAASERDGRNAIASDRPYVLLSQPSLFDATRAPAGMHTAWGYCHVPNGSTEDFSQRIEDQVERFAPGFRNTILARHVRTATDMERWNPNLLGGDITGGAMTLKQIVLRTRHRTPIRGVYLCSSSTAPGGGVHGMCGWHAASAAAVDMGLPRLRLT
ncbi:phytoene desaturase family protein [Terriglobus roseus]|uniref:Pyridine nucleotide-disulfide oxidoreductase domain-containing protein 2 n=1 Tax=Terriglobus roseus TaxID=392734 RepID=A0A1G7HW55_9BACT|nr:NAD(P)/FAD-dependent oxidoreductase [Terriglobus roseus]SDF04588.1 Phytoene dehydrogenase-related protein [Terriglobus roseus]